MSTSRPAAHGGDAGSKRGGGHSSGRAPKGKANEPVSIRGGVECGNNPQPVARKVIGHYMLGKTIGEGTFGKVKIAIHLPTGEKVAVKILEKSRIKEQADVRRVNREIKILKKARHGNIIQLYEVLDTPNTIYLMMENAEGGEMFDYIVAHRYVPELQACKFFHQIVDGVDLLHKSDITHRDLKPENLLLKHSSDGWIVKIVDFGLSNTHEGGKLLSTACGSPCYAAPEMIAGKQYVGPTADIWSMGVILFALVCGFLPFEDANTSNLYRKILAGDYKPAKWISSDVKDLIRRILETDPRRRYTVEDIRKHPWYGLAPESSIPKDLSDSEKVKADTIAAMAAAGMDVQAVLDALQSHTCNSVTAMYYLLAQKSRANKKLGIDKDKMQNLAAAAAGGGKPPVGEAAGADAAAAGKQKPAASAAATAAAAGNGSSAAASGEHKQGQAGPEAAGQRRSRTPTPTRGLEGAADAAASAAAAPTAPRQPASQQPHRPSPRMPQAQAQTPAQAQAQAQAGQSSAYSQGGSSVLHKLQQQHQLRMGSTAMPLLDAYMGATGSGNEGTARIGKVGAAGGGGGNVHVPPVVPKLNIRGGVGGDKGPPLVSQTSRPRSGAGSTKPSVPQQQQQQQQQQSSFSAREPLPSDPANFDLSALATEIAAVPMPTDLLGPIHADISGDRPSTRRSRLRSRGAGDERPQSAAGGLDVPNDRVTNAAPVTMHMPDGSDATSLLRVVQAAPDASKRSSAPAGGRKGKHLKAGLAATDAEPEREEPDVFPDAPPAVLAAEVAADAAAAAAAAAAATAAAAAAATATAAAASAAADATAAAAAAAVGLAMASAGAEAGGGAESEAQSEAKGELSAGIDTQQSLQQ